MSLRAYVLSGKALNDYAKFNRDRGKNFTVTVKLIFFNIESGVKTSPTSFP